MDTRKFLGGRVTKYSLPVVEPGKSGNPALKRLILGQGELAQFYDDNEGARYIAMVELKVGSVRGNHFHVLKDELIYVLAGQLLLLLEDPSTKTRESVELMAGDVATISPGIAHALQTVHPGYAIECSKVRFDPEDVHRYSIV
jgi:quercetin dioxygenase-like cupin family protein